MLCGPAITQKVGKERMSSLINGHENPICGKLWIGIRKDGKGPEDPSEF